MPNRPQGDGFTSWSLAIFLIGVKQMVDSARVAKGKSFDRRLRCSEKSFAGIPRVSVPEQNGPKPDEANDED
ncbi:MAG: hypothetical protein MI757_20290, partial [Pirellulales bacterium]|nr:hypothetical protein [Pirellulales bacterium]